MSSSDIEHLSDVHTLEAPLDVDKSNITALLDVIKKKERLFLQPKSILIKQLTKQFPQIRRVRW